MKLGDAWEASFYGLTLVLSWSVERGKAADLRTAELDSGMLLELNCWVAGDQQ